MNKIYYRPGMAQPSQPQFPGTPYNPMQSFGGGFSQPNWTAWAANTSPWGQPATPAPPPAAPQPPSPPPPPAAPPTRGGLLAIAGDSTKSRTERLEALLQEIQLEHPGAPGYSGKYQTPERRQILQSIDADYKKLNPQRPLTDYRGVPLDWKNDPGQAQAMVDYGNRVMHNFRSQAKHGTMGGLPGGPPAAPVHVNKRVGARDQRFKPVALKR